PLTNSVASGTAHSSGRSCKLGASMRRVPRTDILLHRGSPGAPKSLVSTSDGIVKIPRDTLGVNDSDLSKQATALAEAEYLTIKKVGHGRGSVTTYEITRKGKAAYEAHRAALQRLLAE